VLLVFIGSGDVALAQSRWSLCRVIESRRTLWERVKYMLTEEFFSGLNKLVAY
jgi:hypothetical protein